MPTRGPLPPAVYRRRRLMVLGTVLALTVATVDLVRDDEAPAVDDTVQRVVAAPQETPSETATPGTGKRKKKRQRQQTSTPPPAPEPEPPDPVGTCEDADVAVTPVMAPAVAGRPVLVTLSLRTIEAEACTWQVSREHLAYKVTAGDDDVWSSAHCPAQVPTDEVVVRRDFPGTYRLAWSGRASSTDCPDVMDFAPPGDYAVQAAAIGGEPSAVVPFTLADPAEVVTPTEPLGPPVPGAEQDDADRTDREKKKRKRRTQGRGERA